LSSWHRDIDDLFGRFFGRPELRLTGGVPPMETYRKDGNYVMILLKNPLHLELRAKKRFFVDKTVSDL
jgi:hypothetical protein